ncbi:MAG: hypothetical protein FWG09_00455 [Synergistaceae bacterium]|nr:hypothetical protein [Synergistaceae bacterium]
MKTKALVFSMLLLGTLLLAVPCLAADFYVYCADGKIVVDTRVPGVYKMETKAKDVNIINKFSNQKDAETRARHAGGIGSNCK